MATRLVDDLAGFIAMRQRLQECISVSAWDEREVYRRLARKLDSELPELEAPVIEDVPAAAVVPAPHKVVLARASAGVAER